MEIKIKILGKFVWVQFALPSYKSEYRSTTFLWLLYIHMYVVQAQAILILRSAIEPNRYMTSIGILNSCIELQRVSKVIYQQ